MHPGSLGGAVDAFTLINKHTWEIRRMLKFPPVSVD